MHGGIEALEKHRAVAELGLQGWRTDDKTGAWGWTKEDGKYQQR